MELFDIEVIDIKGNKFDLHSLQSKTILIVNTASVCGFTPQFESLEKLYQAKKDDGLMILGFPCNDFGGQDSGTNEEILSFCSLNYGVTFPMMSKVKIKGEGKHPLFQWLEEKSGSEVEWNFHKFLVLNNGTKIVGFESSVAPFDNELFELI